MTFKRQLAQTAGVERQVPIPCRGFTDFAPLQSLCVVVKVLFPSPLSRIHDLRTVLGCKSGIAKATFPSPIEDSHHSHWLCENYVNAAWPFPSPVEDS